MYEYKLEISGHPDLFERNLTKPQAATKIAQVIKTWTTPKHSIRIVELQDDGNAVVDLYQDGNRVGRASAYKQPSTSYRLTGKYKDLTNVVRKLVSTEMLVRDVSEVINEILANKWPGAERPTPTLTVKDMMEVPGFWMSEKIVRQLVASFAGRVFRKSAAFCGLNPEDPEVLEKCLPILEITDKRELAAVPLIIERVKKKHGEPEGYDPAKIKELETKLFDVSRIIRSM